jgi:uncharacterized lipoprotein YbaY
MKPQPMSRLLAWGLAIATLGVAVVPGATALAGNRLAQSPIPANRPASPTDGTLVFSQTPQYAVRVFNQNGQTRLNLFNKATRTALLTAVPVQVATDAAATTYRYSGPGETASVRVQISPSGAQTLEVNGAVLQNADQITGSVTYLPRIAMPPHAVVEIALVDVSRADAAAITLASQTIVMNGRQVPIPFELVYDPAQIDPRMSYAVQARITVDGQLRFINTRRTAVLTQGNPSEVEVIVDPVSR